MIVLNDIQYFFMESSFLTLYPSHWADVKVQRIFFEFMKNDGEKMLPLQRDSFGGLFSASQKPISSHLLSK